MEYVIAGIGAALAPHALAHILIGVSTGILFGAVPGLTGAGLMVLALPVTFFMESHAAIYLLIGMYVGGMTGGLITAILLRIPGSPANVITTFDGYPMARSGRAERALGLGVTASFFGGFVSWLFLVFLSPPLSRIALSFSDFEYFSFILMGLVLISSVSGPSLLKGLMAGVIGMLIAMPGLDPSSGQLRLTFGFHAFVGGFHFLPVLIGVFAGSQLISEMVDIEKPLAEQLPFSVRRTMVQFAAFFHHVANAIRSSVIGTWIGILPGVGGNIGSIVSYTVARNFSKTPEQFGTGVEEGVVASEAANNATIGGALIPLITMGIPGSIADVILLAALIMHHVQPGPLLLEANPDIYYGIICAMFVANIAMLGLMIGFSSVAVRLVAMRRSYLIPAIFVFAVVGAFALNGRVFDVGVMVAFAIIGFAMEKAELPLAPFVIGLILAPIAEEALRAALMASDGSFTPFVARPISLACLIVAVAFFAWPFLRKRFGRTTG